MSKDEIGGLGKEELWTFNRFFGKFVTFVVVTFSFTNPFALTRGLLRSNVLPLSSGGFWGICRLIAGRKTP